MWGMRPRFVRELRRLMIPSVSTFVFQDPSASLSYHSTLLAVSSA